MSFSDYVQGPVKGMDLFVLDNPAALGPKPFLAGDLVLWQDSGKYPTYTHIALASHPSFDGRVVILAGNRGIVLICIHGAHSIDDVKKALAGSKPPEPFKVFQYRISVEGLIHRFFMWAAEGAKDDLNPLALMAHIARSHPTEENVLSAALELFLRSPEAVKAVNEKGGEAFEAFETAEALAGSLALNRGH